ncbi:MAG: hypothetical protein MZU91_08370 [Desulfosudis oleivorans]|nr:hypothetical protein [Desulfosudis oleivorans]
MKHAKPKGDRMQTAQRALLITCGTSPRQIGAPAGSSSLSIRCGIGCCAGEAARITEIERANIPDTEVLSWLAEQAGGWWHWDEESRSQSSCRLTEVGGRYAEEQARGRLLAAHVITRTPKPERGCASRRWQKELLLDLLRYGPNATCRSPAPGNRLRDRALEQLLRAASRYQ